MLRLITKFPTLTIIAWQLKRLISIKKTRG